MASGCLFLFTCFSNVTPNIQMIPASLTSPVLCSLLPSLPPLSISCLFKCQTVAPGPISWTASSGARMQSWGSGLGRSAFTLWLMATSAAPPSSQRGGCSQLLTASWPATRRESHIQTRAPLIHTSADQAVTVTRQTPDFCGHTSVIHLMLFHYFRSARMITDQFMRTRCYTQKWPIGGALTMLFAPQPPLLVIEWGNVLLLTVPQLLCFCKTNSHHFICQHS